MQNINIIIANINDFRFNWVERYLKIVTFEQLICDHCSCKFDLQIFANVFIADNVIYVIVIVCFKFV